MSSSPYEESLESLEDSVTVSRVGDAFAAESVAIHNDRLLPFSTIDAPSLARWSLSADSAAGSLSISTIPPVDSVASARATAAERRSGDGANEAGTRELESTLPPTGEVRESEVGTWGGFGASVRAEPPPAPAAAYHLRREIARGGMGEVWEAEQESLRRAVAVKRLRADRIDPQTELRHHSEFRHEALVAARLEHPNILPVHDLGVDELGRPLLAMKLVRGAAWDERLAHDFRDLEPGELIAKHVPILVSVAQAIAFAHSRGIVHRDLKPAQVMLGEFGEVLLMDWGLAVYAGPARPDEEPKRQTGVSAVPSERSNDATDLMRSLTTPTNASNPSGTPALMAPEQTEETAARIGPWTDVYLLGGTLYYLLTGSYPHGGGSARHAFERARSGVVDPPAVRAPNRPMPADLVALAMSALAREPEDRTPSAAAFVQALSDHLSGARQRRESQEACEAAKTAVANARQGAEGYGSWSAALQDVGRALTLWSGNQEAARLQSVALEGYARAALAQGDLTLARVQAGRLPAESDTSLALQHDIEKSERAARHRERTRFIAIRAAEILLIAIVLLGALGYRELSKRSETIQLERDRAFEAEALARTRAAQAMEQSDIAHEIISFTLSGVARRLDYTNESNQAMGNEIAQEVYDRVSAIDTTGYADELLMAHSSLLTQVGTGLRGIGWLDEADEFADRALAIRERLHPDDADAEFAPLYLKSTIDLDRGDWTAAIQQMELLYASRVAEHGTSDLASIEVLNDLGRAHLAIADPSGAVEIFEDALSKLGVPDEDNGQMVRHQLMMGLARGYRLTGKVDEAERLFVEVEQFLRSRGRVDPATMATLLTGLAYVYEERDELERVVEINREALALRRRALPPNHPDIAESAHNLGQALIEVGEIDAGLDLTYDALDIFVAAYGETDPRTGIAKINLGEELFNAGIRDGWRRYMEEGREAMEASYGLSHSYTHKARGMIYRNLAEIGRIDEARALADEFSATIRELYGEESLEMRDHLWELARAYLKCEDWAGGEPILLRVIELDELLGDQVDPTRRGNAFNMTGNTLARLGRYEEALPYDWAVFQVRVSSGAPITSQGATLRIWCADAVEAARSRREQGDVTGAEELLAEIAQQVIAHEQLVLGNSTTWTKIADALEQLTSTTDSRTPAAHAVEIIRAHLQREAAKAEPNPQAAD